MGLGKSKATWEGLSYVLAMLHNTHFTERVEPRDYNPHIKQKKEKIMVEDLSFLKGIFK